MPRQQLELALEGKPIQVVFKGANIGVRGVLLAWDQDLRVLLVQELADNGVTTDKCLVIPFENIQWFSFEGRPVYANPP